jgi:molybdopterin synthase catalytic subunit
MANPVCEVLLTDKRLEPENPIPDETGAVVDFWGVVRRLENDREIGGIEYEANATMAEHQLRLIARKAIEEFSLCVIIVRHRLGFVAVTEASVFVRVATRNRAQAFAASQWIMNELKSKVPIWKKPIFNAGNEPEGKFVRQTDLVSRR